MADIFISQNIRHAVCMGTYCVLYINVLYPNGYAICIESMSREHNKFETIVPLQHNDE